MAVVARARRTVRALILNPETDFVDHPFQQGRVVYAQRPGGPQPLRITEVRLQLGRPILAFEGVGTIEDAEWLVGGDLRVPVEALQRLPDNTVYRHDLVGCRVCTASGLEVGTVVAVEGPREVSYLVVRQGRQDVLVPLAADICVEVDVGHRRIVIDPPEGLLELNQ
jgi:16S rRNA processing protein RimM